MIKSFKHKGLERYFTSGDSKGLPAHNLPRISRMLDAIDEAIQVKELDVPGWFLHPLKGAKKNLYSLRVSGNWRMTFEFVDGDAYILNLEDYH